MKAKNVNQWTKKTCLTATFAVLAVLCAALLQGAAFAQGNIEAASFNSDSNVQTENCAEGGLDVGYISNGSWVEYNQVDLNGATAFQARVASAGSGGNIEIHLDSPGGTLIGKCAVPVTGGWQSWTTVTANVSGASGFHNVYLVFTGSGSALFNVEWFAFQGVANETEAASYNNASNVQTEQNSEGGGQDVGYISNGSWVEYNQVNLNGVTSLAFRTASAGSGGTISVYLDSPGGTLIGTAQISPTGGWQTWATQTISLSGASGCHNVYFVFNGSGGGLFNLEWFAFLGAANGTEGASYNNENSLQTQNCSEGGLNLGYISSGSWSEYNQVNMNGVTGFSVRTASAGSGGTISIYLDSPYGTLIGTVPVPGSGGWQNWTTETVPVSGATGYHNVYLVYTSGFNVEWFSFLNSGFHTTAAGYNIASNVQTENCSEGGQDVGYLVNGSYIQFNQVNFNGASSFTARTASDTAGGSIGIHLDSPNGTLVGTMTAPGTGGWQTWSTQTIPLNGASGCHNVYLVFTGGFNVQWFNFGNSAPTSQSTGSQGSAPQGTSSQGLSMLHAAGTQIVNANGAPVQLTGVNLGSLMIMEGWMCPLDSGSLPDNYSVIQELDNRFGVATEQSMIRCYQTNWITTADLQNIKNAGFNCVRVPVWWGDFFTLSSYGSESGWRSDAFTELDWIVNNCANYGLYVIIDMHGVVGGQSTSMDCGQQNQNAYWTNGNYQGDTAWMWWQIANHYKGNATVAGYDLINEPDGAPSTSAVWTAYNGLYNSIRSADPGHMIIMEDTFGSWDWDMLPNPATYGWTNVAYEAHEYEYNSSVSQVEGGSQVQVEYFNAHKSWNVPAYVGEFNDMGLGAAVWDYSINLYNGAGMSWTIWAYKAIHGLLPDGWGWYDPTYWPATPNISTDSAATICNDWQQWQTPSAFGQNSSLGL